MGPLIPQDIISAGWSYVIAFIVGLAFGAVLESSGFSSSRKIVGLFYGYDFTVLRVFFTATVTAMIGLLYFDYLNLLDLGMIYVLPTYLTAALVGGVVMGLGFILGGFCPGTGICGLAIGKIDALVFVVGLYLGILLFSFVFPYLGALYESNALGQVKVTESLGVSTALFTFLFLMAALTAFVVVGYIEKRVNKAKAEYAVKSSQQ